MSDFSQAQLRAQFPLIGQASLDREMVYFDNGATTQKPNSVIETESSFYRQSNSNVHRASFSLAARATEQFENCRKQIANFLNTKNTKEIIFTKGTTESINLIAQSWGRQCLKAGDEIIVSVAEHHANIVPWQMIAEQTGARVKWLDLSPCGRVDLIHLDELITKKTKIIAINHVSNVLGVINPIQEVVRLAKRVSAIVLVDGAQSAASIPIDVQALGVDFYVCSAHKMYGPTGVGILYGRKALLEKMPPYQTGGEMIAKVTRTKTTFNELPFKFEAGTPNIAGVVAFAEAIRFIEEFSLRDSSHKKALIDYAYEQLSSIPELSMLIEGKPDLPIFSFTLPQHIQDVAANLDGKGIAVRAGSLCAMPLMEYKQIEGCLRVSLAPYNTLEEIDYFISVLKQAIYNDDSHELTISPKDVKVAQSAEQDIRATFESAKGWDSKQRAIMLLGKSFNRMERGKRLEQTLVQGCESKAWVSIVEKDERIYFEGDSDARIIRGLLAIIFAAFEGKTREDVLSFDIKTYFDSLGLIKHLSPSRGNGLNAVVAHIHGQLSN